MGEIPITEPKLLFTEHVCMAVDQAVEPGHHSHFGGG